LVQVDSIDTIDDYQAGTDILIPQDQLDLFTVRERTNNENILGLLIRENLTAYKISKLLEIDYTTIFDRLKDLKKQNIIEAKGRTRATKSGNEIILWGLTTRGLGFAATQEVNLNIRDFALAECQRKLSSYWNVFWKLYEFDLSTHGSAMKRFVRRWMRSDEGIIETLRTFGPSMLEGESQALIAFRRMLDIGIILVQSEGDFVLNKLGIIQPSTNFTSALTYLARIALDHPKLRKLHDTIREIDGPLYSRIRSDEYNQTVVRLSTSTSAKVAQKLAMTPFFRDNPLGVMGMLERHFVDTPLDKVVRDAVGEIKRAVRKEKLDARKLEKSAKRGATIIRAIYHPSVQKVVLEPGRYRIVTSDPGAISDEWLRNSHEVYVIDREGEVKVREGEELVNR